MDLIDKRKKRIKFWKSVPSYVLVWQKCGEKKQNKKTKKKINLSSVLSEKI